MTTTVDDRPFVHDPSRSFEFNALEELAWLRDRLAAAQSELAALKAAALPNDNGS